MARQLFVMAFLAVLAASASALTIDAPASVPEHTSWGFSVALDPTDVWSKTSVQIDGTLILDVYPNGTITPDPYNGQFVLKSFLYDNDPKSTSGLTLYVSHFGLLSGSHTISAASENMSDTAIVLAFAPLNQSDANAFNTKIGSLEEKSEVHDAAVEELGTRITRASLDFNRTLKQSLEPVNERLDAFDVKQQKLSAEVFPEGEKKGDPIAGLFNFAGGFLLPLGFIVLIVVVLALVVSAVILIRNKFSESSNPYPKTDEYNLPVSKESEEMAGALSDGKGKWKLK